MAITRTDIVPTLVENTTMQKVTINGVDKLYEITPVEGYVLHDKRYDMTDIVIDENTGEETEVVTLGYRRTTASCTIAQFEANTYEFYTVPESDVPADSILGGVNPPAEVM